MAEWQIADRAYGLARTMGLSHQSCLDFVDFCKDVGVDNVQDVIDCYEPWHHSEAYAWS